MLTMKICTHTHTYTYTPTPSCTSLPAVISTYLRTCIITCVERTLTYNLTIRIFRSNKILAVNRALVSAYLPTYLSIHPLAKRVLSTYVISHPSSFPMPFLLTHNYLNNMHSVPCVYGALVPPLISSFLLFFRLCIKKKVYCCMKPFVVFVVKEPE